MTFRRLITIAALVLAPVFSLNAQQKPILPPGTGACFELGCTKDTDWLITGPTTAPPGIIEPPATAPYIGPAYIVNPAAAGWGIGQQTTSYWIGPAADQTNGTRPGTCCTGSTTYRVRFLVTDVSVEAFSISLYADDTATVILNQDLTTNPTTPGTLLYTGTTPLYQGGTTVIANTGFHPGLNWLDFVVSNATGGPTGLYALFKPITITPILTNTANGKRHLEALADPVDSGSGQFYESESDIELGGPMDLGFRRYYSSQLQNGNISTALGTNWMSNFDALAVLQGANANVLLFGGKVVSFANSSGGWQLVTPKDTAYQFIQSGKNFQFLDPDSQWIYTFTTPGVLQDTITGVLTSISDRNGNTATVTQGANGPTQVSDGLGRTLTFTYANSQLAQVTDQASRTFSFSYSAGLLASATNIYKQTTHYYYITAGSSTGLMQHKQLPLGNIPASQTYDLLGRVLAQRVVIGNDGTAYTTKIAYDGNGGTTITDAFGNVTKHVNSGVGNIMHLSDPTGATAIVTYDGSDRRTSITDKVGNRTSFAYDPQSGLLSSMTDALGNTTSLNYVSQTQDGFTFYYLAGISYPDGTSVSRTYDVNGNLLIDTGRKGTTTTYAYDSMSGRTISVTGANQQTSTYTWNTDNTMASSTDALGNKRTFTYDNTKRMTSLVDPNGATTSYVWDKSTNGPMLATIFPVKGESTTVYDDQNNQIQDVVIPTGGVFHSEYTTTGQFASYADPLKNVTSYAYDGDDRMNSITSPAGEVVSYAYDSSNRVTSISDANGPRTTYTYTAESKIATATDGSGKKASYAYDALGRLATITTPAGNTYKTGYDKLGQSTSWTNPLSEVETLTRDAAGAIVSATAPGTTTTTLARDAAGMITSVTTPNGNTWKIGYDAQERPTKYTDPLGNSTALSFTGTRLTSATLPLGTVAITNDADGRITQRQFSDGTTINRAYDTNGMVISADGVTIQRDAAGRPTNINGIGITLDANSRPATLTYASGKSIAYTYDKGGRLATVSDWVGGKTTLGYDGAGRVTSLTYPNGIATTYSYDPDGRVTQIAAGGLSSIALTRDAAGKITSADRSMPLISALQAGGQQFSYDPAGQLTSATSDAMGRVTARNGRKYTWNLASQLISFADGSNTGTFTYDGLGEMSSSTASGAAQSLVFNYLLPYPALSIVRQGASDLRYYVYFPNGTLLYSIEAADNTRHFYHFDEMGNTVMLTGDSGAMTDSYTITPYGENADHIGTTDNPFTWQGQYGVIQEGDGLYYVRSRHYDASVARFISRDPETSADPRAAEPYAYASGNPLLFIDPFGTDLDLPGRSPLQASAAEAYAFKFECKIISYAYLNRATLSASWISFYHDLENTIQDNGDLDWAHYYSNSSPFWFPTPQAPPPPPSPDPPPVTHVILKPPAPGQVSLQSNSSLGYSGGAAGSSTGLVPPPGANLPKFTINGQGQLVSMDGGGAISHDGGTLISQDGGSLISQDGGGFVTVNGRVYVISHDGGTLLSQDGSGLTITVSSSGAAIIGENSSGILGNAIGRFSVIGGGNLVGGSTGTFQ